MKLIEQSEEMVADLVLLFPNISQFVEKGMKWLSWVIVSTANLVQTFTWCPPKLHVIFLGFLTQLLL